MIGILASIPGKLATLLGRLTAGRATNLDNLDATISTRAIASSALSNAQWTNARATKLDYLDVPVSSVMPVASSVIQSIQYGTLTWGNGVTAPTVAISAVVVAKSALINLGTSCPVGAAGLDNFGYITLQSNVLVAGSRQSSGGGLLTRFCVVEFK
jgi:ABC-type hemin transport system ATPase subunit